MSLDALDALSSAAPRPTVAVEDLVAEPGFAPREWQSEAPLAAWESARTEVEWSIELERILALPYRAPPELGSLEAEALVDYITPRFRKPDGPCRCAALVPGAPCILRLREVQAWALFEGPLAGGLLGPIGVGHGKTLLDLLMPLAMRAAVAVLLVPANLLKQLIFDYEVLTQHWRLPKMIVHGRGETDRQFAGDDPTTILHVLSYTRLSRPNNTAWLTEVKPDLIIADECDKLKDADTATTSRFLRFLEEHRPRFCGWSGSMSDASINDYAHLAKAGLGQGSPLPTDADTVRDWARALDPTDSPAPPGALMRLCDPSIVDEEGRGEHIHAAFYRRLTGTRGVVHTTTSSSDVPVVFEEVPVRTVPPVITRHLSTLRNTWARPDEWTYESALEMSACAVQLACGFYYRWEYLRGEPEALIKEWLDTRKAWTGELRAALKNRREHLDSEKLLKEAAARYHGDLPNDRGLPVWRSNYWPAWRDIADAVKPTSVPQMIDPFLADEAAAWATANRGVVWYASTAFGRWIAERAGLPMYGAQGSTPLTNGKGEIVERGDRSIIASIKSHGRGRNGLQFLFRDQLVAQPPSSAQMWEQMLGRLSRPGQAAASVRACYYGHTRELAAFIRKAIARAAYVRGTLGADQRILTGLEATFDEFTE